MTDIIHRFSLKHRDPDGTMVFGAPHELHNEVLITTPPGYFNGEDPMWIDVPNFTVITEGMQIREREQKPASGTSCPSRPSVRSTPSPPRRSARTSGTT